MKRWGPGIGAVALVAVLAGCSSGAKQVFVASKDIPPGTHWVDAVKEHLIVTRNVQPIPDAILVGSPHLDRYWLRGTIRANDQQTWSDLAGVSLPPPVFPTRSSKR